MTYRRHRSRSRSPNRRFSITCSRRKRSRSRSRSRSLHRGSRNGVDRPEFWGPKDSKFLSRAVLSPHRLIVVRKTARTDGEHGLERRVSFRRTQTKEADIRTNYPRRNSRHEDRRRRSRSGSVVRGHDNSRGNSQHDKKEEKKIRGGRDERQREHRDQNVVKRKKIEEKHSAEEMVETVENSEAQPDQSGVNVIPAAVMPIGPFPPYARVPLTPYPIPMRPPHLLPPRYPHHPPFIPRPPFVRLRPFLPNRFYPPVPPMY